MSEAFLPGFGPRLKAGREQKQLALAEVAAKLKLTARQVEALEEDDLSHLPSEVFVRGFVRNYARLVDVEVDSLIAPLDVQAAVAETITAPSAGVSFSTSGVRQWVILPLAALAVFLLLVAVLYHWLRKGEDTLVTESAPALTQPAASVPAPAAPAHVQPLQPAPQATIPPDGASASPAAPPSAPAGPPPSSIPATAAGNIAPPPEPEKPAAPSIPPPSQAGAALRTGDHTLRFEPAHDAWIQVVDSKGSRFSKLVRAGAVESFSGEPPFRLVVGEAARVRMSYDGHVIDLTPFIGQKVARLTLE